MCDYVGSSLVVVLLSDVVVCRILLLDVVVRLERLRLFLCLLIVEENKLTATSSHVAVSLKCIVSSSNSISTTTLVVSDSLFVCVVSGTDGFGFGFFVAVRTKCFH